MAAAKRKKMCAWKKKDIEADFDTLLDVVRSPKFVCTKCARVADQKACLCKPAKIA